MLVQTEIVSHLATTAILPGTRQLTTDILFGSTSYGKELVILFNGS
jgi:hypothetical protein